MQCGATQAMRDIVEEHQRSRCPCGAGTLWAHRGCGQSLRCSSSTMSRIDSSSRLELASQALCARPVVLLSRAASPEETARGSGAFEPRLHLGIGRHKMRSRCNEHCGSLPAVSGNFPLPDGSSRRSHDRREISIHR
jgi:hypothetical protein